MVLFATVLVWAVMRHNKSSILSPWIPSPDGNWLMGFRTGLPFRAHECMRHWAIEYGELFQIRVGWHIWVVVNSPPGPPPG